MRVEKKQVQNFVQEVKQRQNRNSKFTPQHIRTVMPSKYVKEKCQVWTEKNIVQVLIVN
jgi:hypothetical protein